MYVVHLDVLIAHLRVLLRNVQVLDDEGPDIEAGAPALKKTVFDFYEVSQHAPVFSPFCLD